MVGIPSPNSACTCSLLPSPHDSSVSQKASLGVTVKVIAWITNLPLPCGLSEVKWNEVTQSCPTLCDPKGCSLPGSSVRGIFQAWILEWVAISFSRGSSWPRDQTRVSHIAGRCFTVWATRGVSQKVQTSSINTTKISCMSIHQQWAIQKDMKTVMPFTIA